jgi:hypothetical protein
VADRAGRTARVGLRGRVRHRSIFGSIHAGGVRANRNVEGMDHPRERCPGPQRPRGAFANGAAGATQDARATSAAR